MYASDVDSLIWSVCPRFISDPNLIYIIISELTGSRLKVNTRAGVAYIRQVINDNNNKLVVILYTVFCFCPEPRTIWWQTTQDELQRALKVRPNVGVAKNVILFMGDGMGLSNIMASRVYQAQTRDKSFLDALLSFEKFPYVGLSRVRSVGTPRPFLV